MSAGLDPAQRTLFAQLADVLAPATTEMPSASAAGVAGDLLDEVLNYRPDLRATLLAVLRQAQGKEPPSFVRDLEAADPEAFRALGLIVAGAYYLSADVRERIGYPGQERRVHDADAVPDYISEGLLDRVVARGPLWRTVNPA